MSTLLLSFSLFSLVASATPGPTNLISMSNGSRFGTRATLPFALGGSFGAALVLLMTLGGFASVIQTLPILRVSLGLCGALWLSWLAWKLFHSPAASPDSQVDGAPRARSYHGALMQLINPKTWMMALTASSLYAPISGNLLAHNLILAAIFFTVTTPCILGWAWLGAGSARLSNSERGLRRFNQLLAALLLISVWSALLL